MDKMNKRILNTGLLTVIGLLFSLVVNPFAFAAEEDGGMFSDMINLDSLTNLVMITAIVVSILLLVVLLVRIKRSGLRKITSFLLIIAMLVNIGAKVAINRYNILLDQFLAEEVVTEEEASDVTTGSREITELLQNEGVVLLKNSDSALPLQSGNINVFGYASQSIIFGGSGSGAGDESKNITLREGLRMAGFTPNDELYEFYKENKPEKAETNIFALAGGDYSIYEMGLNMYSDEMIENAKTYSDTALIVFARSGGEGGDLPLDMAGQEGGTAGKHYLELSENERALLEMIKDKFEKTIVVINSSNAMELGFLEDEAIDAGLMIGGPGSTGLKSVANILAGHVNPSGRLVDTYAYDATSSPAYYNAGDFTYTNTLHDEKNHMGRDEEVYYKFVNYVEGIYIGYRYYETRYVDNKTGEMDETAYHNAVQYPFGYGLSYTTFSQKMDKLKSNKDEISVTITVENTGDVAGKDVVQLYYRAPYTEGGIEKSHVNLAAFGKTKILEPGEKETIELTLAVEDMASYDYIDNKAYVLEEGIYEIILMSNAHDVIDSENYKVNKTIIYDDERPRESDQKNATNLFDDVAGELVYLSRADWEGTFPKERTKDQEASEVLIDALSDTKGVKALEAEPILIKDNGLILKELEGLPYDDPKWTLLLEQLSISEMKTLIGTGGFQTAAIKSIDKGATIDIDGPAGLNGLVNGVSGVQFCSEVVIGQTWNEALVEKMGKRLGEEAKVYEVTGLYAPSVNIHRTPFSGRNFEYYSEDSILSGVMGAAMVRGAKSVGVFTYVKHFALNDQEINRVGLVTWSNEQAIREIYLKPFELTVKSGGATGMMSSFNRLGTVWAGASKALLTDLLREEWGVKGAVISDYVMKPDYMDANRGIEAGNDIMLSTMGTKVSSKSDYEKQNMRKASHNILYAAVNRGFIQEVDETVESWLYYYIIGEGTVLLLLLAGLLVATRRKKDKIIIIKNGNQEA